MPQGITDKQGPLSPLEKGVTQLSGKQHHMAEEQKLATGEVTLPPWRPAYGLIWGQLRASLQGQLCMGQCGGVRRGHEPPKVSP